MKSRDCRKPTIRKPWTLGDTLSLALYLSVTAMLTSAVTLVLGVLFGS